jgi:4-hydroxyphenylpyruvate dioxygenase
MYWNKIKSYCFTTPLTQDSPIHEHLRKHGDGVAALWVEDAKVHTKKHETWCSFLYGTNCRERWIWRSSTSGIYTYGETVHILWSAKLYGFFTYKEWKSDYNPEPTGFISITWKWVGTKWILGLSFMKK